MNCSYKDCKYHGEFYLVGLLPDLVKRGETAWTDTIYCKTHALLAETRYADIFPLGRAPAAIMRIGVLRRVRGIEDKLDCCDKPYLAALLRSLRMFVENAEEGEFSDHQTV